MTLSYSFDTFVYSIRFNADWSEQYTSSVTSVMDMSVPDTLPGFTIDEWNYIDQNVFGGSTFTVNTSYGMITDTLGQENPISLQTVTHDGVTTDVLVIDRHVRTGDYTVIGFDMVYIYLDGAPLPEFSSVGEFEAWRDAGTWGWGDSVNYPPGTVVPWENFDIDQAIIGGDGNDHIDGTTGSDTIYGGDGADTIVGGAGNDTIYGGDTSGDLRDVIYGGDGDDWIDGGYGNDSLRGDAGNDTIEGGFGADTVVGGFGNDVLTGSAWSDLIFGNDGDDFINGGFGCDRMNGGAGADKFYHLGVAGHGTDWVQDYTAADNDVLVFGNTAATRAQFQVNFATTTGAGDAAVQEAFVIYRPTGQIMWALIDGAGEGHIWLRIGAATYDLLAA